MLGVRVTTAEEARGHISRRLRDARALAGAVMSQFKTSMSAGRLINSAMDVGFGWRAHGEG